MRVRSGFAIAFKNAKASRKEIMPMGVKKIMQPISSLASLRGGESPDLEDAAGSSFEQIQACLVEVGQVVRGHSAATRLLMSTVLARSHALI